MCVQERINIGISNEICDTGVLTLAPNNDLHLVDNPIRVSQIIIFY